MVQARKLLAALILRLLDAPLDVADRLEVLDELHAVALAERSLQVRDFIAHRIEQAAVPLYTSPPRRRIRTAAVAEETLEDRARVVLGGQGSTRAEPRDRVGVRAGEADVAGAGGFPRFDRQLERGELRERAGRFGDHLIHRDAGIE